ncbi:hypothetical protein SAMD00019534_061530, partial [Acytostelium subglobosum LB1]|uniref:hypothetical protein n=1 Tax=Acytostelium subglobosum LB1 TaxID=1410327 RepID=UPI000644C10B
MISTTLRQCCKSNSSSSLMMRYLSGSQRISSTTTTFKKVGPSSLTGIASSSSSIKPYTLRHYSVSSSSSGSSDSSNNTNNTSSSTTSEQQKTEEQPQDLRQVVLDRAMQYVPLYGWSEAAIAKACTDLGYAPTMHGLFENGGYDLAFHFVNRCNKQLKEKLSGDVLATLTQRERVKMVIKVRLSMITPYLNRWAEAMQLLAHPSNLTTSAPSMASLVDEIWHLVDDRSTDFEWYTKRGLLAALYTSSELYMLNDTSPEHKDTWRFVDDRVDDMVSLLKFNRDIGESAALTANMLLNYINGKRR